jgi:hypothetical protein
MNDDIFLAFRALRRFATLNDEVQYRQSMYGQTTHHQKSNRVGPHDGDPTSRANRTKRPSVVTPLSRILPDRLLKRDGKQRKQPKQFMNASSLKTAFSEFYLMLILLQNFQLLNFTGFRKILKKHDKVFQTTRGEEWR